MPNYEALNNKKAELIRKAIRGSFYLAPITAGVMTNMTDSTTGALLALPTTGGTGTYSDVGFFTPEGLRFERAITQDEVTSFGSNSPTRTDITSDTETVQVDVQETNKMSIALYTGADPAALIPNSTSGELKIVKPDVVSPRRYRGFGLAVDGPPELEIYIGRFYPRLVVTDFPGQAYAQGQELRYGATLRAEKDATVGSSLVYFFGGPGFLALKTQMGFAA